MIDNAIAILIVAIVELRCIVLSKRANVCLKCVAYSH